MDWEPRLDGGDEGDRRPLRQRLGWLALIWVASVALLGAVAYGLRLWLV
jgi:hypothetical protein